MNDPSVSRRRLLQGTGIGGALAVAGCLGGVGGGDENGDDGDGNDENGEDVEDLPAFPEIEDPPAAVYTPTHREEMAMSGVVTAGEYALAPTYTYPHQFWLVSGDTVEHSVPEGQEDVHLMVSLWDEETDTVVPVDGVGFDVYRDDERVGSVTPWTMVSQEMGFHFGDNVTLDGGGTYRVEGTIPPLSLETFGELEGRFDDRVEFEFEFEYSPEEIVDLRENVEYFPEEEWGERGALEPMSHGEYDHDDHHDHDHGHVPHSSLPPAGDLPGTLQGADDDLPESGDAEMAVTLVEPGSRFADDEWYLLVSPRTPYNRCILPQMNLEVILERNGERLVDGTSATEAVDHVAGHHYGLALEDVAAGDAVTLEVTAPPQVTRHQGYETAFIEMETITLEVTR